MLRGGSWYFYENLARAAYRYYDLLALRLDNFGFRVVRAAPNFPVL